MADDPALTGAGCLVSNFLDPSEVNDMTWWQAVLVFVGIPLATVILITVVVLRFTVARVPDGLARAAEQQGQDDPASEHDDGDARDQ